MPAPDGFIPPVPDGVCDGGSLDVPGGLLMILRGAMERIADGAVLEIRSREPTVAADLPSWCRMTGHEYLGLAPGEGGVTRHFVRRRDLVRLPQPDWGIRLPLRPDGEL